MVELQNSNETVFFPQQAKTLIGETCQQGSPSFHMMHDKQVDVKSKQSNE